LLLTAYDLSKENVRAGFRFTMDTNLYNIACTTAGVQPKDPPVFDKIAKFQVQYHNKDRPYEELNLVMGQGTRITDQGTDKPFYVRFAGLIHVLASIKSCIGTLMNHLIVSYNYDEHRPRL